jgi:hypothetical protein
MWYHTELRDTELRRLLRTGEITLAGNVRLKIYGTLQCYSGKRMKRKNRIFFTDEVEAVNLGFRACKHCMLNKSLIL